MSILGQVNWSQLDKTARKQQRNREAHAPVISLYRWWARRPHAVAGALLDAAQKDFGTESFVVADPFSGGGTVAFEAVRRGLPIYAQDLYRWPSFGLAVCLTRTDRDELERAARELLEALAPLREEYRCGANGSRRELTHVIRVRAVDCSHCRSRSYLFRYPFISFASRSAKETSGFFGCTMCGNVTLRRIGAKTFACDGCGVRQRTDGKYDFTVNDEVRCWHCRMRFNLGAELSRSLIWHPMLVQERDASSKDLRPLLRTIRPGDPVHDTPNRDSLLVRPIVEGLETRYLRRSGFRNWRDVFTDRQVRTITEAMTVIESLDVSSPVRERLRLAVLGAAEMAAYLCRWERFHPKAIEAIANHRFARSTVVVETNLLSPVGRGTMPHRLNAVIKALDWMAERIPHKVIHRTTRAKNQQLPNDVLVVTGSSERQLLPDGVVSLVLTDPPYHDDLQYGELSRLFHAWMAETLGGRVPDEQAEAVPNSVRGADDLHYAQQVAACLRESRRTLKKDGRLILTFHNRNLAAWGSLAGALRKAGFLVVGLATVSAENSADHSKRGKETFLCDLVIECKPAPRKRPARTTVTIQGAANTQERKELIAMGRALAACVNSRTRKDVSMLYPKYRGELGAASKLIS